MFVMLSYVRPVLTMSISMLQEKEKEAEANFAEFDKDWSEVDRREKRVGNWRDFQDVPEAKKVKASSYKEETRQESKHGQVSLCNHKGNGMCNVYC